jgi:O-antigen ligase
MIVEMMEEHPVLGFSFGKPQRSISIEAANWAPGEWQRDGWITPHNVFLHMIYRAGIIGLVLILGIIGTLFYLTRVFLRFRSLCGILLVSVLLYWLVVANFLVVLELPYQAIPFWSFWGLAMWHGLMMNSDRSPKSSMISKSC